MSRVVSISTQALTISNGDQCLLRTRYCNNLGADSLLSWLAGLLTRAMYATRFSPSGVAQINLTLLMFDKPTVGEVNAIKEELRTFGESIVNKTTPKVSIEDGYNALVVAHQILEKLKITGNLSTQK